MMEKDLTIVILGRRPGHAHEIDEGPKVLHRAGGKALIEHVVDTSLQLTTPERIFVVVGHQADQVAPDFELSRHRLHRAARAERQPVMRCSQGRDALSRDFPTSCWSFTAIVP